MGLKCFVNFSSSFCLRYVDLKKGDEKHSTVVSMKMRLRISGISISTSSRVLRKRALSLSLCLNATGTRILENAPARINTIEIPVTCYQLLGVPDQAEKDEIVKSVMQLKSADIEEGYTMDALVSRQDVLMDVRDKLLFEPEYAGNIREKIPPKSSLQIPWAWLPGILCLLQEVGEEKLVLDIGQVTVQHPDAKPYTHDVLLSMALAECAIAKIAFEKNKVSHGFEALARAQSLLRSKISLGKIALRSQIEESLEELAPACALEILGMPHCPENAERRRGAISALHELLRQGLDVESSCRVQDWPCFLSQALNRLMATEIVDLLPWVDLAVMRKNKKSLESQNQRVVIDFHCFHVALVAHIALGFSSKQIELIDKAKTICDCLMASEGIDLKLEEAFCFFLLGQGNEAEAIEKLHRLELNLNHGAQSLMSGKEIKNSSSVKLSLETWLKVAVLAVFSDTRDCSPSLIKFFSAEKRTVGVKQNKVAPKSNSTVPGRPLSNTALKGMDCGEPLLYNRTSQNLGSAVKQLASTDLQYSLILGKNDSEGNASEPSVQLKRNLGAQRTRAWDSWLAHSDVIRKITLGTFAGCIILMTCKLSGMSVRRMKLASQLASNKPNLGSSSTSWATDSSVDYIKVCGIAGKMKKLLAMVKLQFKSQSDSKNLRSSGVAASISSSMVTVCKKVMPFEEAEALVKQWQAIKAESLGPSHQVHLLFNILDESMLAQWQALADAAKAKSCHWRFVLLQLSVLQADILLDGTGLEMAEIEALLEEVAELVDESQWKNPNYHSTYKVRYLLKRQDDGSWRFCEGDIEIPS